MEPPVRCDASRLPTPILAGRSAGACSIEQPEGCENVFDTFRNLAVAGSATPGDRPRLSRSSTPWTAARGADEAQQLLAEPRRLLVVRHVGALFEPDELGAETLGQDRGEHRGSSDVVAALEDRDRDPDVQTPPEQAETLEHGKQPLLGRAHPGERSD